MKWVDCKSYFDTFHIENIQQNSAMIAISMFLFTYYNFVKIFFYWQHEIKWIIQKVNKRNKRKIRRSHWKCFVKEMLLKISPNSQAKTFAGISFLIKYQAEALFIEKETTAQFFSSERCEFFANKYFVENLRTVWSSSDGYLRFM